ncbi:hypothetical protein [Saccharothrix luteola]|uniref:hypothetical protein n=1 Tax=Saccharothrix luteola TaxID=2893018 RepID=UPI001E5455CE|nr:hypothetical protein [Saccharothrix luteola]MCC8250498.1 hypothetical protein [Saccharothrix luteola]
MNAGTKEHPEYVTWWERYVEQPLGRRPRRTTRPISTLPGPDADLADGLVDTVAAEVDAQVITILLNALRGRPEAPADALRTGIARLVEHGLLTERSRLASAARELSAMA